MTSLATTFIRPRAFAIVAMAFSVAACSSCSSSSSSAGDASGGATACKTGKEAAFANPAGTPFTLPAGVTVEGNISGDIATACANKTDLEYGSDLILACVALRNSTAADVTVTVPAGLVFVAKNPATQNGIILQSHDLKVPAGAVGSFYFRPFSLNQACAAGGKDDLYSFGNVASDAGLREVITLASTKLIDGDNGSYVLGQMLWDVTDGNGITDEHRTLLMSAKNL